MKCTQEEGGKRVALEAEIGELGAKRNVERDGEKGKGKEVGGEKKDDGERKIG